MAELGFRENKLFESNLELLAVKLDADDVDPGQPVAEFDQPDDEDGKNSDKSTFPEGLGVGETFGEILKDVMLDSNTALKASLGSCPFGVGADEMTDG